MARPRARTSTIWTIPLEELKAVVERCFSYAEILREIQVREHSAYFRPLKQRIREEGIDVTHISAHNRYKNRPKSFKSIPLASVLVENSTYNKSRLKERLLQENLLPLVCSGETCILRKQWLGKPIVLQLDHINGAHNDHRLENLRLLCPNCHSQTETFSGKQKRNAKQAIKNEARAKARALQPKYVPSKKGQWPSDADLRKLVWEKPVSEIAVSVGVSGSCVKKHCKRHGIPTPPKGYWQKEHANAFEVIAWPTNECLRIMAETMSTGGIAKKLGVSQATVHKRLHKLNIPFKPKGFWQRRENKS